MDLKGKYLTIKVNDDNARVFFDLPRESGKAGKQWMVMPAPGPYTTLIRWDWILTAVATADKSTEARPPMPLQEDKD